jgi:sensor histidine kinase YesM
MSLQEFFYSGNQKTRILRHITAWLLLYIFAVCTYPPKGSGTLNGKGMDGFVIFYRMVFIRTFLMILSQMLFAYLFLYILVPRFLRKKKYLKFTAGLLGAWIVTAIFRYAVYTYIYNPVMAHFHYHTNDPSLILLFSIRQTISGPAFLGGLFIAVKLFKDRQQKQKDFIQLQMENASAEIQLLKTQIHPHFLFNTLNNIYSFTINRSPKASELVHQLYALMYYMVNECNEPFVSLDKEIHILKSYFELEKIRYGSRLLLDLDIQASYPDMAIAPLLMIPFLENSFKHGTSKTLASPWIKLRIHVHENLLNFHLVNGKPAEHEAPTHKRGIGLANVTKRLQLIYGSNHLLQLDNEPESFSVIMQVPITRPVKSFSSKIKNIV